MSDFELRNRHGDVVQRGVAEVRDLHQRETEYGEMIHAEIEFRDPVSMRKGDQLSADIAGALREAGA